MGPLVVSGPGPIEPGSAPAPSPLAAPVNTSKPSPPLPPDSAGGLLEVEGSGGEEDDEEEGFVTRRSLGTAHLMPTADPYASLDTAFGGTTVDDVHLRNADVQFALMNVL